MIAHSAVASVSQDQLLSSESIISRVWHKVIWDWDHKGYVESFEPLSQNKSGGTNDIMDVSNHVGDSTIQPSLQFGFMRL